VHSEPPGSKTLPAKSRETLQMEYDVANVFKAAWRVAALRQGRGKPGQDSARYDGEKIVFFGQRIVEREDGK
jgi:hypothetical protein